jgi:hypothetical protein
MLDSLFEHPAGYSGATSIRDSIPASSATTDVLTNLLDGLTIVLLHDDAFLRQEP